MILQTSLRPWRPLAACLLMLMILAAAGCATVATAPPFKEQEFIDKADIHKLPKGPFRSITLISPSECVLRRIPEDNDGIIIALYQRDANRLRVEAAWEGATIVFQFSVTAEGLKNEKGDTFVNSDVIARYLEDRREVIAIEDAISKSDLFSGEKVVYIDKSELGNPHGGVYVFGNSFKPEYLIDHLAVHFPKLLSRGDDLVLAINFPNGDTGYIARCTPDGKKQMEALQEPISARKTSSAARAAAIDRYRELYDSPSSWEVKRPNPDDPWVPYDSAAGKEVRNVATAPNDTPSGKTAGGQ